MFFTTNKAWKVHIFSRGSGLIECVMMGKRRMRMYASSGLRAVWARLGGLVVVA